MAYLKSISPEEGVNQWNDFLREHAAFVTHAFNPSLQNFYSTYFNWKAYYFLLFDERQLVGVFPLINTGKSFVSLPHFSYGGIICTKNSHFDTQEIIQKLVQIVRKEKPEPGFLAFQIENTRQVDIEPLSQGEKIFVRGLMDFKGAVKSNKVSSFIQLPADKETMMKLLSSNLRRKIRKTMTNGLEVQQGGIELLDDFYPVYAHNIHRLGSPPYAKSFFRAQLETYQYGDAKIFLSKLGNKTVGAAFLMSYFGFFENTWFSTDRAFKKYLISDHLHWQMIQYAIEKKGKIYSMGRSTQFESVNLYKNHWPVTDMPLYNFSLNQGPGLKNQKWLSSIWKLFPYQLTLLLGPRLVRDIY